MTLTYFEILSFSNFAQFVKVKNPSILSAYQWPNSNLTSDNHKKGRFRLLLARCALNQKGTWRSWALIETLFGLLRAFAKAPGGILNPPYNFLAWLLDAPSSLWSSIVRPDRPCCWCWRSSTSPCCSSAGSFPSCSRPKGKTWPAQSLQLHSDDKARPMFLFLH